MEKRSYTNKELVLKTYQETQSVSETAQRLSMTKGAVYQAINRCGGSTKRVHKCQEAALYSVEHGIREAAEKFNMKVEAIHHYRCKYGLAVKRGSSKLT